MNTPANDPGDENLRGLLSDLGQAGQQQAPAFRDTWRAARMRQGKEAPRWRLAWTAAATAAMAVIALTVFTMRHRAPQPVIEASLPSDTALPTDFLLVNKNDDPVQRVSGEIDALLRP